MAAAPDKKRREKRVVKEKQTLQESSWTIVKGIRFSVVFKPKPNRVTEGGLRGGL